MNYPKSSNPKPNTSQRGIALITTIIISGIMLVSVGLFTKEMMDEVKNSTRIDNSLVAYYAAEAGMEDALLEWRYDREAEISRENDLSPSVDVTNESNNTPRCVNLDSDEILSDSTICTSNSKDYQSRYYSLKMWYKQPSIENMEVLRDDVVEIGVPDLTSNLSLDWSPNKDTPNGSGYRMEITVYDEDGEIIPGLKQFTAPSQTQTVIIGAIAGTGKKIVRLKPWYTQEDPGVDNITYTEGAPFSTDSIPSVELNVFTGGSDLVTTPLTTIESIGYYGGVARKIVTTLDRSTGNIVGLFDYVIYSESDLVK